MVTVILEIAWTLITATGLVVGWFAVKDSRDDLKLLRKAGVNSTTLLWTKYRFMVDACLMGMMLLFLLAGIGALTQPNPPSALQPVAYINRTLFILVALMMALVIIVGRVVRSRVLSYQDPPKKASKKPLKLDLREEGLQ